MKVCSSCVCPAEISVGEVSAEPYECSIEDGVINGAELIAAVHDDLAAGRDRAETAAAFHEGIAAAAARSCTEAGDANPVAAAGRCLRKEAEQARRAAKEPARFLEWIEDFYAKHTEMVADHCGHITSAWATAFGGRSDYPAKHIKRSRNELLASAEVSAAKLAESVERVVSRWTGQRLAEIALEFSPNT